MPQWRPPKMRETHKKLRDDFLRVLRENYGFTGEEALKDLFCGRRINVKEMVFHLKEVAAELGLPFGTREKTYNSRLAQDNDVLLRYKREKLVTILEASKTS